MLEGDYTNRVILPSILAQVGGVWWKIHGGPAQAAGIPDLVGVVSGRFMAVEVKTPDNTKGCSRIQEQQIRRIRENGGFACVARTREDIVRVFKRLPNGLYVGDEEIPVWR